MSRIRKGKQSIYDLVGGKVSWTPVFVPFGFKPFGWHGERESYREICDFALGKCTLLPKVTAGHEGKFMRSEN